MYNRAFQSRRDTEMSQLVEYVRWNNTLEEAVHIGVLTQETETSVTLLTKYGEMTIPKEDGDFTESTREEFESVVVEVIPEEVVVEVEAKVGSKMEQAIDIFKRMTRANYTRKDIIIEFKDQLDMKDAGASTYYQNIKTKLAKK
jgi:hypothetical protein